MKKTNTEYEVILCPKVKQLLEKYVKEFDFLTEAGGILIGKTIGSLIVVEDLTEPYKKDRCEKFAFIRGTQGHQEYMDKVWNESNHSLTYLGEWHTHNQTSITASEIDYKNWSRILKRNHNTDAFVFLILGRGQIAVWVGAYGIISQSEVTGLDVYC